ncbi:MAG: hypothetical protein H6712_26475 [Myxococcales bacterium]|nr:hypothetical protein [Myxococcales bacterium]MCB9717422.1 hypothetical protein [Myxococcales bacterium]
MWTSHRHLLACSLLLGCNPSTGGGGETEDTGSSSTGSSTTSGPLDGTSTGMGTTAGEASASGESSSGTPEPTSTGADSTGSSGATGCIPGEEEGCACDGGRCGLGLVCQDDVCVASDCGNGMVDAGEECDDMNLVQSDGCDNDCTISAGAAEIVAGDEHVCIQFHTGDIKCWGNHELGRLGYPGLGEDVGDDETPADMPIVDVGSPVEQLALGSDFSCALLAGDEVVCWGHGQHGRLGQGNQNDLGLAESPSAIPPISLSGTPIQIATGAEHACAVFASGQLSCWGRNDHGQVGLPGLNMVGDDELPSDAPNVSVGANVLMVAAGTDHTCALLGGGDVRCWGRDNVGQLGTPGTASDIGDNEDPSSNALVDLGGQAVNISARYDHTCVSYVTGEIQCWGGGASGKLGYGDTADVGDDEAVDTLMPLDLGFDPSHLATGANHTCVRLLSTAILCWGEGDNGRLGTASTMDLFSPPMMQVDLSKPQGPASVTAGAAFSCGRTQGSEVKCWGRNNRGQLGQGLAFPTDLGDNEVLSVVGPILLE